jgi:hypothetical protein
MAFPAWGAGKMAVGCSSVGGWLFFRWWLVVLPLAVGFFCWLLKKIFGHMGDFLYLCTF